MIAGRRSASQLLRRRPDVHAGRQTTHCRASRGGRGQRVAEAAPASARRPAGPREAAPPGGRRTCSAATPSGAPAAAAAPRHLLAAGPAPDQRLRDGRLLRQPADRADRDAHARRRQPQPEHDVSAAARAGGAGADRGPLGASREAQPAPLQRHEAGKDEYERLRDALEPFLDSIVEQHHPDQAGGLRCAARRRPARPRRDEALACRVDFRPTSSDFARRFADDVRFQERPSSAPARWAARSPRRLPPPTCRSCSRTSTRSSSTRASRRRAR